MPKWTKRKVSVAKTKEVGPSKLQKGVGFRYTPEQDETILRLIINLRTHLAAAGTIRQAFSTLRTHLEYEHSFRHPAFLPSPHSITSRFHRLLSTYRKKIAVTYNERPHHSTTIASHLEQIDQQIKYHKRYPGATEEDIANAELSDSIEDHELYYGMGTYDDNNNSGLTPSNPSQDSSQARGRTPAHQSNSPREFSSPVEFRSPDPFESPQAAPVRRTREDESLSEHVESRLSTEVADRRQSDAAAENSSGSSRGTRFRDAPTRTAVQFKESLPPPFKRRKTSMAAAMTERRLLALRDDGIIIAEAERQRAFEARQADLDRNAFEEEEEKRRDFHEEEARLKREHNRLIHQKEMDQRRLISERDERLRRLDFERKERTAMRMEKEREAVRAEKEREAVRAEKERDAVRAEREAQFVRAEREREAVRIDKQESGARLERRMLAEMFTELMKKIGSD